MSGSVECAQEGVGWRRVKKGTNRDSTRGQREREMQGKQLSEAGREKKGSGRQN